MERKTYTFVVGVLAIFVILFLIAFLQTMKEEVEKNRMCREIAEHICVSENKSLDSFNDGSAVCSNAQNTSRIYVDCDLINRLFDEGAK